MKSVMACSALTLALGVAPALADHHGRGAEQLNGFPGIYTTRGNSGTATFTHDGFLIFVINTSNVAAMVSRYHIEAGVMTLRGVSPPPVFPEAVQTCLRNHDSVYEMVDTEGGFSLSVRDEPCAPQASLLDQAMFTEYRKPDAGEAASQ